VTPSPDRNDDQRQRAGVLDSGMNDMFRIFLILSLLMLAACDDFPKDAEATLQKAEDRQTLRIGIIEHRPWAYRTDSGFAGLEVEIASDFAKSLGLSPDWQYLPEARAFEKLEQFQLDLVIGGLATENPRGKRVGMTRPYLELGDRKKDQHVLATPPGENRLITSLEKFLKRQAPDIHERHAEELQK